MNRHILRPATTRRAVVAAVAASFLLAACGSDPQSADTTASAAAASIEVSSVWARTSPTVADAGAVYLTVDNAGGLDDALIAASVDPSIAMSAGLHETAAVADDAAATTMAGDMAPSTDGGSMMEMRPVDRIVVPAQGSVALAPGGYHIMLMGLVEPLTVGSTLKLTLTFETSGDKVVTADVRDTAP